MTADDRMDRGRVWDALQATSATLEQRWHAYELLETRGLVAALRYVATLPTAARASY